MPSPTLATILSISLKLVILSLSFREVAEKFNANLNFANIKKSEIQKLGFFVNNIFSCKNLSELENIDFS